MKRTTIPVMLALLVGIGGLVIVSALSSFSTTKFTNPSYPDQNAYSVTYDITEPGWYLLPSRIGPSVPTFSEMTNQEYTEFYHATEIRYALSPFTKKYVRCERKPNINPLDCDATKVFDETIDFLASLPKETLARDYFAYTVLSADWFYYDKPVKISYDYQPYQLYDFESGDDDVGMYGSKLKKGWNLIIYPAYAAFGEAEIGGECNIEKLFAWEDDLQEWDQFPDPSDKDNLNHILSLRPNEFSGLGMAIKVTNDCTFLTEAGGTDGGIVPPVIPNLPDSPTGSENCYTFADGETTEIIEDGNSYSVEAHIESEDSWASFKVDGNFGPRGDFYTSQWGNPLMVPGNSEGIGYNIVINGLSIRIRDVGYDGNGNEFAEACFS